MTRGRFCLGVPARWQAFAGGGFGWQACIWDCCSSCLLIDVPTTCSLSLVHGLSLTLTLILLLCHSLSLYLSLSLSLSFFGSTNTGFSHTLFFTPSFSLSQNCQKVVSITTDDGLSRCLFPTRVLSCPQPTNNGFSLSHSFNLSLALSLSRSLTLSLSISRPSCQ